MASTAIKKQHESPKLKNKKQNRRSI